MDRIQAFTEYGRILQDSSDWLSLGYRQNNADPEVVLPVTIKTPDAASEKPSLALESHPLAVPAESFEPANTSEGNFSMRQIADEIASCRNCNLYLIRQNTVPGVGSIAPRLLIVTPPPADGVGDTDNPLAQYEYEYLVKWLMALGLNPDTDTFITPAVKCRTPGGRPPHPEESAACSLYLRRQYKEIKPHAVLALGAAACAVLTGDSSDFPSLVGRDWTWGAVPALVLWTPAEVLANPHRLRGPVWESLQRLKAAWNAVPGSQL